MNKKLQKEIGWLLREKYNNKPDKNFYKDVKRLKAGELIDYVIGFTNFLDCKIDLSKKPLIPRPETEFWVGPALKEIKKGKVLDIFSGSGCVGVAILKNIKNVKCDFVEKDAKFLKQIKINCKINKINPKKYKIIQSDIFKNVRSKYDFIFANPPYVARNRKNKIQKSVLKYEPKQALFGGKDGLFYIKKFLRQAKKYLNPDGKIYMEFSSEQKNKIEKIIKQYKYSNYKFYKDQYSKWRYVMIK